MMYPVLVLFCYSWLVRATHFPSVGHFRHKEPSLYLLNLFEYTFDLHDSSFPPPNKRPAGTAHREGSAAQGC